MFVVSNNIFNSHIEGRSLKKFKQGLPWFKEPLFQSIPLFSASLIPAACLIGVCLSGCNKVAVVAFMITATLFYGSMFAGVFSNHVDIASNYAGKQID